MPDLLNRTCRECRVPYCTLLAISCGEMLSGKYVPLMRAPRSASSLRGRGAAGPVLAGRRCADSAAEDDFREIGRAEIDAAEIGVREIDLVALHDERMVAVESSSRRQW